MLVDNLSSQLYWLEKHSTLIFMLKHGTQRSEEVTFGMEPCLRYIMPVQHTLKDHIYWWKGNKKNEKHSQRSYLLNLLCGAWQGKCKN